MNHLQNLHVLVLGLGESGLAMARWCARFGAQVRVWDSRENPPHAAALAEHVPAAVLLGGALGTEQLQGVHLVLKSPGLGPRDPRVEPLLKLAFDTGVPVQGELDLFARALADLKAARGYAPGVIAITGTNGKTTTTAMASQLIARAGRRVATAGNIGPTMLQTLAEALDAEPAPLVEQLPDDAALDDVAQGSEAVPSAEPVADAVMEDAVEAISETLPEALPVEVVSAGADASADDVASVEVGPEPVADDVLDAAVDEIAVLPPEDVEMPMGGGPPPHLIPPPPPGPVFEALPEVWVLELSSFQLDGVQGFEPGAATVLNVTQDHLDWHGDMKAYAAAKARIFGKTAVMVINRDDPAVEAMVPAPVPGKGRFAKPVERHVVRFGLDAPKRPGDFGLVQQNGMAWLVRAMEADETAKPKGRGKAAVEEEELHIQRLMPADALRVRGRHNAANALAALALATAIGCPLAPMLHGLREYAGEPHRVEFVALVDGVEAYDDSKGTNVGATVAAINGLGADKAPGQLVMILGGDGKGQDFGPLLAPVRQQVRAVATIGRDAAAIEQALQGAGIAIERHETLQAATRWAFTRAHPGDAVLLSPACASLDMFRNYAHRAQVFCDEVRAIAAEGGSQA
ncbi:UDP-N-acetylmuramoyl-L-alanine--D-glutamate ligase [Rhizobacter sp. SG703]|uniref:UDP-N-acetylmuramoyl-L-alanine--D-glutamate ligase n=1 Tax=Rhizobacter sp. SG703 TaxID=2587140 RepID=UPI001444D4E9|nr:UDP-N-acetylmuramoyl-L-alanine--D-glutamate ligase [Rhizobacter sp. SG703]NKI95587.1 UDP-N-acetylmuramoylalanine--D-glutamate ligase [Rhizobacter sp. SG703]